MGSVWGTLFSERVTSSMAARMLVDLPISMPLILFSSSIVIVENLSSGYLERMSWARSSADLPERPVRRRMARSSTSVRPDGPLAISFSRGRRWSGKLFIFDISYSVTNFSLDDLISYRSYDIFHFNMSETIRLVESDALQLDDNWVYFVAYLNEEMAGAVLASVSGIDLSIESIHTNPNQRGNGVGTKMLSTVVGWGRDKGARRITGEFLPDEKTAKREDVVQWYAKRGIVIKGRMLKGNI